MLVNEGTNVSRDAVTNSGGDYDFVEVPVGTYRLEFDLSGFKKNIRRGVALKRSQGPLKVRRDALAFLIDRIAVGGQYLPVLEQVLELFHQLALAAHRIEHLQQQGPQQLLGREVKPRAPKIRAEPAGARRD